MSSSRPRKVPKQGTSLNTSITDSSDEASLYPSPSLDEDRNQSVPHRTGIKAATLGTVPLEAGTVFEDVDFFFQSRHRPVHTSLHIEEQLDNDNRTSSLEHQNQEESLQDDADISNIKIANPSRDNLRANRQIERQQEQEKKVREYHEHMANLPEPNFNIFKSNLTTDKRPEASSALARNKYIQRIIQASQSRNLSHLHMPKSPSELSHVSTIPPTPASKSSTTKSILKSGAGNKSKSDEFIANDITPHSTTSDKSVRWNVDEDESDDWQEYVSESQLQGSGKKKLNHSSHEEMDDLYPHQEDDENISGLFITRPSPSVQNDLNTTLDKAAELLPIPTSDMKRRLDVSNFDDSRSPPPLEDSMLEMLNNTDDTIQNDGGSNHDVSDDKTDKRVSDSTSHDEPVNYGIQHNDDDDDDDDDNKEGDSFAFASHDSNDSQEENMDYRVKQSKDPTTEKDERPVKRRGRKPGTKASPVSPETPQIMAKNKKNQKKSKKNMSKYATPPGFKGHAVGNREYETVAVSDFKNDDDEGADDDEGNGNVRRSKRARFKPLEYWRNEKFVYEAHNETGVLGEALGHMPIVTGVVRALPTPHARRKVNRKIHSDSESDDDGDDEKIKKTKKGKKKKETSKSSESEKYDSSYLRKKYEINDGDRGLVWSESLLDVCETQIVSYFDPHRFVNLPTIRERSKTESKVSGRAVQSFNAPSTSGRICGWLSGLVNLPPSAIKDAEGVGSCLQHFHVIECQPKALEFALANPEDGDGTFLNENAQRFLLSKGDAFYVPPGNLYRLENHSESEGCLLSYTIFRPFPDNTAIVDKRGKRS